MSALKPFAALRQTIGGITTEKGLRDYLVLLSLCETCRYIGLDFLDFLRSGEKDIHAFADSRRRQRRRLVVIFNLPSISRNLSDFRTGSSP